MKVINFTFSRNILFPRVYSGWQPFKLRIEDRSHVHSKIFCINIRFWRKNAVLTVLSLSDAFPAELTHHSLQFSLMGPPLMRSRTINNSVITCDCKCRQMKKCVIPTSHTILFLRHFDHSFRLHLAPYWLAQPLKSVWKWVTMVRPCR